MTNLQILGMPQSPLVWAVRMVAEEKGLAADLIPTRPHTPEILAIQPFGKMPALRHGNIVVGESSAIARYIDRLDERNPLIPRNPAAAAPVEQWLMHFHAEYLPTILMGYIAPYFFPKNGTPDRAVIDAGLPALRNAIAILEARLVDRDTIADDFSMTEVFFGPLLHYVNGLPEGAQFIGAAARVSAYLARLSARPAFRATLPPPMPERAAA